MHRLSHQLRTFTAALLAALWAASPLLVVVHGTHAHRYCVEHRAIEELPTEGGVPASASRPLPPRTEAEAPVVLGAGASGTDAHQACPLLTSTPRLPASSGPGLLCSVRATEGAPAVRASASAPQLLPLVTAPKASPPVV